MKQNAGVLLTILKKWYDRNGLVLNTEENQHIFFGTQAMIRKIPK